MPVLVISCTQSSGLVISVICNTFEQSFKHAGTPATFGIDVTVADFCQTQHKNNSTNSALMDLTMQRIVVVNGLFRRDLM